MAFKSEIHVAELASIRTGHTEGDIYYILDNGMLGDLPCKPGDFVEWHNNDWRMAAGERYALESEMDAVVQAIGNLGQPLQWKGPATVAQLNAGITGIQPGWTYTLTDAGTLTDGSVTVDVGDEVAWTEDDEWFKVGGDNSNVALFQFTGTNYPDGDAVLAEQAKGKTVVLVRYITGYGGSTYDYYYLNYRVAGTIGGVSATYLEFYPADNSKKYIKAYKDLDAAEPTWVWTLEDSTLGSIKNGGSKTEADLVEGVLSIASTNSLTKLTLTSAQTLTVLANAGTPNFAIEIDNTGNSNDVTVTVKDSPETATLNPSYSGGTKCYAGKFYQLTCVGTCWNITEYFAE